ncbi:Uncharacterised protein [Mycobacterium tuberculosis]|uniref:Uncharacterized protein n=1 Tax=Mycobacterium tuberculosis TaxID=1773 RepID=A0A654ZLB0_MYCTX|nr:Uncharacterised protein [Mycobacterium tuberculosis]CFR97485.1 Uncharacterised protein [Mycobacterium tuberculosis]CKP73154.1 Uncharacterised protein [Mycobacterium tuberculosis]CKQ60243.1 Uncharacterised protein [Mycobacterium tuberculosis]CKU27681.1 Uncharacterised protein [Mycobacterium tuberculosis]
MPIDATSQDSGRTPTSTRSAAGSGTGIAKSGARTTPWATAASMRFIAGAPMNVATNVLTGSSYSALGVSTCCSTPSLSTATRSPIVIAST